jgi:hypothetical protein
VFFSPTAVTTRVSSAIVANGTTFTANTASLAGGSALFMSPLSAAAADLHVEGFGGSTLTRVWWQW